MKKYQKGFTLIELMIVLAIIGLLAAVALPAYTSQVQQSRRSDVMDLLTDCAAAQTRNFTTASPPVYLNLAGLTAQRLCNSANMFTSKDGHYSITAVANLDTNDAACTIADGSGNAVNNGFWCFTLTARPIANGAQSGDTTCGIWTIDHRGVQTATTTDGMTDTTDRCWKL